jgi:hypothetical protein
MVNIIEFPAYRKLANHRSLYRIHSYSSFDELQLVGSKVHLYSFEVSQFPDLLKIRDMVYLDAPYLLSDALEFEAMFKKTK